MTDEKHGSPRAETPLPEPTSAVHEEAVIIARGPFIPNKALIRRSLGKHADLPEAWKEPVDLEKARKAQQRLTNVAFGNIDRETGEPVRPHFEIPVHRDDDDIILARALDELENLRRPTPIQGPEFHVERGTGTRNIFTHAKDCIAGAVWKCFEQGCIVPGPGNRRERAPDGTTCPDGTDADEPADRGWVCQHEHDYDVLREETEAERAALVHIMLDIEEWKVEKQGAWTTIASIEKRAKAVLEKEPAPCAGDPKYDTPARRAGEAMPIVFPRAAVIALADAAGDALDATRDELNGTNTCAWWQALSDALDAIPGWPAADPDREVKHGEEGKAESDQTHSAGTGSGEAGPPRSAQGEEVRVTLDSSSPVHDPGAPLVYISSSWKNRERVRIMAATLRVAGFRVYDFTDPKDRDVPEIPPERFPDNFDPEKHVYREYITAVPEWRAAVECNRRALDRCDIAVLMLPCGNDAHADAFYALGAGKRLIVVDQPRKDDRTPTHMWAEAILDDDTDVLPYLRTANPRSKP